MSSEFVQVLNISRSHWVTVSNIGCQSGCVKIYDSLPNCDVPTHTKEQIAALRRKISRLNFQQCKFSVDLLIVGCFLWHLPQHARCAGDNPTHVNYTQLAAFASCSPLRMFYSKLHFTFPRGNKEKEALGAPGPSHS